MTKGAWTILLGVALVFAAGTAFPLFVLTLGRLNRSPNVAPADVPEQAALFATCVGAAAWSGAQRRKAAR